MVNESAPGSWWLLTLFSAKATIPSISSSVSVLVCPSFARAQGKLAENEILCIVPSTGSLSLQLSVPGREKPCCFSQLDVIWVLFRLWFCKLGILGWGLDPTLPRGDPLAAEMFLQPFSCHLWELSQPSCVSSALGTSHVVVKLFLLSVHGYKASLLLLFSCLLQMIPLKFICNSSLVLVGG